MDALSQFLDSFGLATDAVMAVVGVVLFGALGLVVHALKSEIADKRFEKRRRLDDLRDL